MDYCITLSFQVLHLAAKCQRGGKIGGKRVSRTWLRRDLKTYRNYLRGFLTTCSKGTKSRVLKRIKLKTKCYASKEGKHYGAEFIILLAHLIEEVAEFMEVTDAKMEDGLLQIILEKIVPEEQKPKSIEIK